MKNDTLKQIITTIWNSACKGELASEALLDRLHEDGGHDTEDINNETVEVLLNGSLDEDWDLVAFSASEMLAYYLQISSRLSTQQVAATVFCACVLADGSRSQKVDWSMEHDKVMAVCAMLGSKLELEVFLPVMTYIFGKGGFSPISGS